MRYYRYCSSAVGSVLLHQYTYYTFMYALRATKGKVCLCECSEKGEELRAAVEEWQTKRAVREPRLTTGFLDGIVPIVDSYELKVLPCTAFIAAASASTYTAIAISPSFCGVPTQCFLHSQQLT